MKINVLALMAPFMAASVALMSPVGSAKAEEQWFVLGEQQIRSIDPSITIKSVGNRWEKDIKEVKLSVEGADVEITDAVLHWDNRPDDTVTNVGILKSGGQTAAKDAPGRKGRLTSVSVKYKILNDAETAILRVWGYD